MGSLGPEKMLCRILFQSIDYKGGDKRGFFHSIPNGGSSV
jgi:hypothetical protein